MSQEPKRTPRQAHYNRIPYTKRLELISLVEEDSYTISEAALSLKIKLSTAKLIVARFRKTKTIFRRKSELSGQEKGQKKRKNNIKRRKSSIQNVQNQLQVIHQSESAPAETAIQNLQFPAFPLIYLAPCQLFSHYWNTYPYN